MHKLIIKQLPRKKQTWSDPGKQKRMDRLHLMQAEIQTKTHTRKQTRHRSMQDIEADKT